MSYIPTSQRSVSESGVLRLFSLAIALFACCPTAIASARDDQQIWSSANFSSSLSQTESIAGDVEFRFSDNASRLGRTAVTIVYEKDLSADVSIGGGYAMRHTNNKLDADFAEHRVFQQISFHFSAKHAPVSAVSRTRVEQRYMPDRPIGLRLRQRVSLSGSVTNTLTAKLWTEPYFHLRNLSKDGESGLDQWRNFAGLEVALSKQLSLEAGYMHVYNRSRESSRSTDVAIVAFSLSL